MHDIRAIRANPEILKAAMLRRAKPDEAAKVEAVLALDEAYRKALTEKETLLARRNAASKEIGQAMAAKDAARAEALKAEVTDGKARLAALEAQTAQQEAEIRDILSGIPNIPAADVPVGADEHGNVLYAKSGHADIAGSTLAIPKKRIEQGQDHVALGEALGMMDFETAAKMSGARFVVTSRHIARLERALGQFMLDVHTTEHGYTEVNPPILVKDDAMFGTAQLPKFREDQFLATSEILDEGREKNIQRIKMIAKKARSSAEFEKSIILNYINRIKDFFDSENHELKLDILKIEKKLINKFDQHVENLEDLAPILELSRPLWSGYHHWLIPTAEVPLTNLVREKILSEEELPLRFTALTPCFRAEAGSAGRDTRGMLRQHQFNKVEMVSITTPEKSADEHERMLACAESVLKKLGLHFRTMTLCTGDMGFASTKTYDIEVWLPGQNTYREISSCSVCGDFQAMRMGARFRPAIAKSSEVGTGSREDFAPKKSPDKNTRFVHTLNGSGVAVGRCLIAVMENYQNTDGSISVPDVLVPYMGGMRKIEKA